jgi:hypothetical protein
MTTTPTTKNPCLSKTLFNKPFHEHYDPWSMLLKILNLTSIDKLFMME